MASGVAVSDGVIKVSSDVEVCKSSTPEEVRKHKKAVGFCLSKDKKNIIPGGGRRALPDDVGQTTDDRDATFVKMLPHNYCHYALYDTTRETKNSKKEDPVFIFCALEPALLKSKMISVSSKDAIKKKLMDIKHELQANLLYEEVKNSCTLSEKLGASVVISLEGKPYASPLEPPAAPCLEYLAAPDPPTEVAGCTLPARLEGVSDPSRGRQPSFQEAAVLILRPGAATTHRHRCQPWPGRGRRLVTSSGSHSSSSSPGPSNKLL
ncbi:LOW QUALITY PROTEIN: cofilin-1-like [Lynx canadensis]|uniref:LOW QUALITY PROTEIN: cofilin-1-like n=1 Tax=Lynx canadensis TaxID=61383 RepID=UPI0013C5017B|nr:LOW QUALITY PROTEIN: cofilin-1-like [Lynx canadensis]